VVQAVDKKKARLNCISHLLEQIPYRDVPYEPVMLPERVRNPDYHRAPVPADMYVPEKY
jgi:polyphosphate kinase